MMQFTQLMKLPLMPTSCIRLTKMVLEALDVSSNEVVLDIGYGSGANVLLLSKHPNEVVGIDISKPVIEYLENSPKPDNVKFYTVDVTETPPPEFLGKFDKSLCIDVLEHVENPFRALEFCHKVLKDKGCLVMTFPINNPHHGRNYFTRQAVDDLLKGTNFKANVPVLKSNRFGPLVDQFYAYLQRALAPPQKAEKFEEYTCFEMMQKPRKIYALSKLGIILLFKISQNSLYHEDEFGSGVLITGWKGQ